VYRGFLWAATHYFRYFAAHSRSSGDLRFLKRKSVWEKNGVFNHKLVLAEIGQSLRQIRPPIL
jgi:hypothetical protein